MLEDIDLLCLCMTKPNFEELNPIHAFSFSRIASTASAFLTFNHGYI